MRVENDFMKLIVCIQLGELVIDMREAAQKMIDFAQHQSWIDRAKELQRAADMCQEWSINIKEERYDN